MVSTGKLSRDQIAELVHRIRGTRSTLLLSTRLYHDLHISGDDAAELLEDVAKQQPGLFKVMDFCTYFPPEGEAFWFFIASKFGYRDSRPAFTFGHLLKIAEQGYWTAP